MFRFSLVVLSLGTCSAFMGGVAPPALRSGRSPLAVSGASR